MKLSRRGALAGLASVPGLASTLGKNLLSEGGNALCFSEVQEANSFSPPGTTVPISQKMSELEAHQALMQIPELRDLFTSGLYEQYRNVTYIDPDIAVLRSFSPMAKITFQRQRIVNRNIEVRTAQSYFRRGALEKVQDFIYKKMWG